MGALSAIQQAIHKARSNGKRITEIRVSPEVYVDIWQDVKPMLHKLNVVILPHKINEMSPDTLCGIPMHVVTNTDTFDLVIE